MLTIQDHALSSQWGAIISRISELGIRAKPPLAPVPHSQELKDVHASIWIVLGSVKGMSKTPVFKAEPELKEDLKFKSIHDGGQDCLRGLQGR